MERVEAVWAEGVVRVVAGSKQTTLYAVVTDDPRSTLADAAEWTLGVVPERERAERHRGYDRETITRPDELLSSYYRARA